MSDYRPVLEAVVSVVDASLRSEEKMARISRILLGMPDVAMTVFYVVDPENPERLVKGPSAGLDNPHEMIPVGKGLCGQVAERQVSIVLDDVSEELNYLPIHPDIKSEIALPVFRQGQLSAVLDVMSTAPARFGSRERLLLEEVCLVLTDRI